MHRRKRPASARRVRAGAVLARRPRACFDAGSVVRSRALQARVASTRPATIVPPTCTRARTAPASTPRIRAGAARPASIGSKPRPNATSAKRGRPRPSRSSPRRHRALRPIRMRRLTSCFANAEVDRHAITSAFWQPSASGKPSFGRALSCLDAAANRQSQFIPMISARSPRQLVLAGASVYCRGTEQRGTNDAGQAQGCNLQRGPSPD